MDDYLQNCILDAFSACSRKREKILQNGRIIEYRFVTFTDISEFVKSIYAKNDIKFPGIREIKRKTNNLIENNMVVEVFGEPPIYLLTEEFIKYKKAYDSLHL